MNRLLLRSARRFYGRHPWQGALAVAGVALGVAVVTGVDLAGEAAERAFRVSHETVTGRATHQLLPATGRLNPEVYVRLRRELGLTAAPLIEGGLRPVAPAGPVLTLLGVDPLAEPPFSRYLAGADGPGPSTLMEKDAVLMTAHRARSLGLSAGDRLRAEVGGRVRDLLLAGTVQHGGAGVMDDLVFADIATADVLLGAGGRLDRVDLILDDAAAARLESLLPAGTELVATAARSRASLEMTRAFQTNLLALSLLALLVGGFLIYSTLSFLVVRRRAQIGTLRTLGVTRGELFRAVLGEAVGVGLPGTLIGLALGSMLGIGLTRLVARTIDDLYFRLEVTGVGLDPVVLLKGGVLGLAVSVLATLAPAAEAASVSPRAVMSRAALERRTRARLPWLVAGAASCGLVAWLLVEAGPRSLVAAFAGLFFVVAAGALLAPPAILALMKIAAGLARRLDMTARLAVRGVAASLSRTGVATAALMVAVATVIGVDIMIASFRTSVQAWLEASLRADVYVRLEDEAAVAGVDGQALALALGQRPGIAYVTRSLRTRLPGENEEIRLWAVDPGPRWGLQVVEGDPEAARAAFMAGEAVLVSEPWSRRRGVGPGDAVSLPAPGGERRLPVAGVFRDYTSDRGIVAVHLNAYRRIWNDPRVEGLGLIAAEGVGPERVKAIAEEVTAGLQGIRLAANAEIREASLSVFDRTFTITRVLQLLVGIVAFLGILGALQSLQMERNREFAVLRALGWTPGQVRRLILTQTGLLGLAAGLLAVPLGLLLALMLVKVINVRAFAWSMGYTPHPAAALEGLVLALSAALAGGAYPAWRASARTPGADLRDE